MLRSGLLEEKLATTPLPRYSGGGTLQGPVMPSLGDVVLSTRKGGGGGACRVGAPPPFKQKHWISGRRQCMCYLYLETKTCTYCFHNAKIESKAQ